MTAEAFANRIFELVRVARFREALDFSVEWGDRLSSPLHGQLLMHVSDALELAEGATPPEQRPAGWGRRSPSSHEGFLTRERSSPA